MATYKKKVAMIGSFSVGKTSLVKRFCHSIFSEKYLTTVGVSIEKKVVDLTDHQVSLVIWDIQGESDFSQYRRAALRGASGVLVVADKTRIDTVHAAIDLEMKVRKYFESKTLFLLNKSDLTGPVNVSDFPAPDRVIETSAKSADGVDLAFTRIAQDMLR